MRKLLSILGVLLIAASAYAFIKEVSPGAGTVKSPASNYNNFPRPNKGAASAALDTIFNERVRRLTDDHAPDDIYARNMWWNADETRYLHGTNDGYMSSIDVSTGAVRNSLIPTGFPSWDAGFDPVYPNVLYYVGYDSQTIRKVKLLTDGAYNCSGGHTSICEDDLYFTAPDGQYIKSLGGTLNWIDRSGRYVAVRYAPTNAGEEPNNPPPGTHWDWHTENSKLYIYSRTTTGDIDTNGPYLSPVNTTEPYGPNPETNYNYLGISPDGQYVVGWDSRLLCDPALHQQYPDIYPICDSDTTDWYDPVVPPVLHTGSGMFGAGVSWRIDHVARTIAPAPKMFWSICGDHGSFISASDGRTYMLNGNCIDSSTGTYYRVNVDNDIVPLWNWSNEQTLPFNAVLLDVVVGGLYSGHVSSVARGDWGYISTEDARDDFRTATDPILSPWLKYDQEIVAVNVLNGQVRRLAHHRSRSYDPNNADDLDPDGEGGLDPTKPNFGYSATSRLSAGWKGKLVGFPSNFNVVGTTPPDGEVDIYAVAFDPAASVVWTNLTGLIDDQGTLRYACTPPCVNGAKSTVSIPSGSNGYLTTTASELSQSKIVGLSDTFTYGSNSNNWGTMDYSLRVIGPLVVAYQGTSSKGSISFVPGDKFRIVVTPTGATWYKNGAPFGTPSTLAPTYPLYAFAGLAGTTATIANVLITGQETSVEFPMSDTGANQCAPSLGGPHYAVVDENTPNDDVDLLSCASTGFREAFAAPGPALPYDKITNVTIKWRAKKGACLSQGKAGFRYCVGDEANGCEYYEPTPQTFGSNWTTHTASFPNNPKTGMAWTPGDLENLQMVFKITNMCMNLPKPKVTWIRREVTGSLPL